MDRETKNLWKLGLTLFSILIAGSWIWSWINPSEPVKWPTPSPSSVESPTWSNVPPSTTFSSIDPCEDEPTVQDYKDCLEGVALDDWKSEQESNAGLP